MEIYCNLVALVPAILTLWHSGLKPETLALPEEAEASATQVVGRLAFTVWPLSHVTLCIASCMAVCQWRKLCHMTVPLLEESPGSVVLLVEQNAS